MPKVEAAPAPQVVAQMQTAPAIPTPPAEGASAAANARAVPARSGPPYRDGDPDVVPPVALKQALPQWIVPQGTRPAAWQPEAVVEVTIDESGSVVSAVLRKGFHPSYDPQLIKAALPGSTSPRAGQGRRSGS